MMKENVLLDKSKAFVLRIITQYWLELLFESGYLPEKEYKSIYEDCEELIRILVSITKNQKKNS